MSNEDYAAAKREVRLAVRLSEAKGLVSQAETLLRTSEHLTFDSALALLERLRSEEADNDGIKQRCAEGLAQKMTPDE